MTVDSAIAPERLDAEIAAIEDLLVHYEDWRALAQLEVRERKGELPANVASSGLKTLLLDKLATNPLFLRRQTLLKELERLNQKTRAGTGAGEAAQAGDSEDDDLTHIRGIDARLERRLNALNITSYAQIAVWEEADVDYFARTLGLDDAIVGQKWIEQAAVLAARQRVAPKKSASSPITRASEPPLEPGPITIPASVPADEVGAVSNAGAVAEDAGSGTDQEDAAKETPAKTDAANAPTRDAADAIDTPDVHANDRQALPARAAEQVPAKPKEDAAAPARVEPEYPPTAPAMPLPASAYATPLEVPEQPPAEAASLPPADAAQADAEPTIDTAKLKPVAPLPAARYAGAVHEPPHIADAAALSPPRPKVASSYVPPLAPAVEVAAEPEETPPKDHAAKGDEAAQPAAALVQSAQETADPEPATSAADANQDMSAADILQVSLPPLPLKPTVKAPPPETAQPAKAAEAEKVAPSAQASSAAPAPLAEPADVFVPSGASAAASVAAIAAAHAAAARARSMTSSPARPEPVRPVAGERAKDAASATPAKPMPEQAPSAPPPVSPAQPASQPVTLSEAGLLAAAASRSPADAPPPLPPPPPMRAASAGEAKQVATTSAQAERKSVPTEEKQPAGQSAAEARVTIRRAEEAMANAVLRVPGGTDVHLRSPRHNDEKFDGRSYAAYHSEVEEARVEIRRTPPVGIGSGAPSGGGRPAYGIAPPGLVNAAASQAAEAARRAAAEAAARAAAALTAKAAPPQPNLEPAAAPPPEAPPSQAPAKSAATMGRFLKALTGQ